MMNVSFNGHNTAAGAIHMNHACRFVIWEYLEVSFLPDGCLKVGYELIFPFPQVPLFQERPLQR